MNKPFTLLTTLFVAASSLASAAPKRPNILFFITDDAFKYQTNYLKEGQNPDGSPKNLTPHIDSVVKESTILFNQYVTSPVCTPSRFGCITGLYPSRSKSKSFTTRMKNLGGQASVEWNTFVVKGQTTLASRLRDAGYRTGIVGKNHVIEALNLEKPKWLAPADDPEMLALLQRNKKKEDAAYKVAGFDYSGGMYYDNPDFVGVKALASHNLDWDAQAALKFLDVKSDKPFFLYVATTIPHGPGEANRSWNADPRITAYGLLKEPPHVMPARNTIPKRLKEFGVKNPQSGNRANMLWLDDMFGAIINKLKETGQYDNTIILYFNDHGQMAKGTIYNGGVSTEAFIRKPGGFPVGHITKTRVVNLDFTPTLLDLAHVPYKASDFDGRSFLPVLNKKTTKIHDALYFELGFVRGILKGDYKYIALRYPDVAKNMPLAKRKRILKKFNESQIRRDRPVYTTDPMAPFSHVQLVPGGSDAEHMSITKYPAFHEADQLYNIKTDPNEQKNLANDPEYASKLRELKGELKSHLQNMRGTFGEFKTHE